ncbi:MAG: twin-arginine translocase subunit TatC [Actinomycetota bacterium]
MSAVDDGAPPEAIDNDGQGGQMSLIEHLEELRSRLMKSILAIVAGAVVAWVFYPQLFDVFTAPLCDVVDEERCQLVITDPVQGLSTRLRVAGYGGIALAMPVILWQVWRFVTPGLYAREKRLAIPFVGSALVLFALGAGLAYWTLPRALEFLIDIGGDVEPFFTPDKYIQLVTYMMLAFGIGFEFPILLVFLQMAGVLSNETLRSWRRYAIVGIVVMVAVITPSGDPISLLALSVPMYLFYEASILIGRLIDRRRRKAASG